MPSTWQLCSHRVTRTWQLCTHLALMVCPENTNHMPIIWQRCAHDMTTVSITPLARGNHTQPICCDYCNCAAEWVTAATTADAWCHKHSHELMAVARWGRQMPSTRGIIRQKFLSLKKNNFSSTGDEWMNKQGRMLQASVLTEMQLDVFINC